MMNDVSGNQSNNVSMQPNSNVGMPPKMTVPPSVPAGTLTPKQLDVAGAAIGFAGAAVISEMESRALKATLSPIGAEKVNDVFAANHPKPNGVPSSAQAIPKDPATEAGIGGQFSQKLNALKSEINQILEKLKSPKLSKIEIKVLEKQRQALNKKFKAVESEVNQKGMFQYADKEKTGKELIDLKKQLETIRQILVGGVDQHSPKASPASSPASAKPPAAEAISVVVVQANPDEMANAADAQPKANVATSAGSGGSGGAHDISGQGAASGPGSVPADAVVSKNANAAAGAKPAPEAVTITVVPANPAAVQPKNNAATSGGSGGMVGGQGILGPQAAAGAPVPGSAPAGIVGSEDPAAAAAAVANPVNANPLQPVDIAPYNNMKAITGKNTSSQIVDIFNGLNTKFPGRLDPKDFKVSAQLQGAPTRIMHNDVMMYKFQCTYKVTLEGHKDSSGNDLTITLIRDIYTNANDANKASVIAEKFITAQSEIAMANINPDYKGTILNLNTATPENNKAYLAQPTLSFKLENDGSGQFSPSTKLGGLSFSSTPYTGNESNIDGSKKYKTREEAILDKPLAFQDDFPPPDKMSPGKTIPSIIKAEQERISQMQKGPRSPANLTSARISVNKHLVIDSRKEDWDFVLNKMELAKNPKFKTSVEFQNKFLEGFGKELQFSKKDLKGKIQEALAFLNRKKAEFQKEDHFNEYEQYKISEFKLKGATAQLKLLERVNKNNFFIRLEKELEPLKSLSKTELEGLNKSLKSKFGIDNKFNKDSKIGEIKEFVANLKEGYFLKNFIESDPKANLTAEDLSYYTPLLAKHNISIQLTENSTRAELKTLVEVLERKLNVTIEASAQKVVNSSRPAVEKYTKEIATQKQQLIESYIKNQSAQGELGKMKHDLQALLKTVPVKDLKTKAKELLPRATQSPDFSEDREKLTNLLEKIDTLLKEYDEELKIAKNTYELLFKAIEDQIKKTPGGSPTPSASPSSPSSPSPKPASSPSQSS